MVTLVDPCDLIGLVRGRDKKERYWEGHERILPRPEQSRVSAAAANATAKVNKQKEDGVKWWKRSPWSLYKEAFLMDRGNQGKELRIRPTETSAGANAAADIEKSAGTGYQSQANMVGPT